MVETPEQFARILHDTPMGVEHFERLITARDAAILAKVADRDALADKCRDLEEAVRQKSSLCDSYNDTQYELEGRIANLEQAVGEIRKRLRERIAESQDVIARGLAGHYDRGLRAAYQETLFWLSELFPELKESTDAKE